MPSKLFKNKYRVDSARRKDIDYSGSGAYFITICTEGRVPFFGNISNGTMYLSKLGEVVKTEWLKTTDIRKNMNISLGEWVVMPDHFHAIIFIGTNTFNSNYRIPDSSLIESDVSNKNEVLDIPDIFIPNFKTNQFGPQSNNLASVVRGFKSAVTTFARKNQMSFNWQSSFHCCVIKSLIDLEYVTLYIENNVNNWELRNY